MVFAKSTEAKSALDLVESLQNYFVSRLNGVAQKFGNAQEFEKVNWLRDEGRHGGGSRYEARNALYNRASVNVSQVHYDDQASKKLSSATAISTIIHPNNPHLPSMHMHISWTQMRDGSAYWRVMADLNPSLKNEEDRIKFDTMLKNSAQEYYKEGFEQGERYFYIPVLGRTRGVSHFYLENFSMDDFYEERLFCKSFGEAVIDTYIEIITQNAKEHKSFTQDEKEEQLAYHTLYFFQVLTLDRGTTSGLLVHSQNDVGIMGSIPSRIDRELLESWIVKMPKPQDALLKSLIKALPKDKIVLVDESVKLSLANAVRTHYKSYPEALSLQASGNIVPPTVDNHS